jgi:hypothetical protein
MLKIKPSMPETAPARFSLSESQRLGNIPLTHLGDQEGHRLRLTIHFHIDGDSSRVVERLDAMPIFAWSPASSKTV